MNVPMTSEIPRFSLEQLQGGRDLDALAAACERWGFFKLADHGISDETSAAFLSSVKEFFGLPDAEKQQLRRSAENPWGYYDSELTKNRRDWKEIFDLGIDQDDASHTSYTPWPEALPSFQSSMLEWYAQCEQISHLLLEAICQTLNQPARQLRPFFAPQHSSFLRLNHYPLCEAPADPAHDFPEKGHLGIYHHTDAGALTVLLQDDVAGLQVRCDDTWYTIEPEPGCMIINVGDLVQVWSNDRYQAPLHRVLANSDRERFSAAFFFNPAFNADCRPLVDQLEEPPRYHVVNWGEFRSARAAGDYADVGEEVQISHYRR